MSSLVISGDTSGAITLSAPAVAGTNTATLPAATGTVMVSGNMPAFSAYNTGGQTVSNGTWTKITINTKEFDTNNCFDSTTNYRFTPTVAGYYQVNGVVAFGSTNASISCYIYKNGSQFKQGAIAAGSALGTFVNISTLIYFNGSTDYIELYGYQNAGSSQTLTGGVTATQFSASMVRSA